MTNYTENILNTYRHATESEVAAGLDWYPAAREYAQTLSNLYGLDRDIVCAVIAVLSPRISWALCCKAAIKLIDHWQADRYETRDVPGLNLNKEKAYRILDNNDPNYCRGPKVRSFYHNIADPNSPDYVTVDIWARRIAEGDPSLPATYFSDKDYQVYADAYREAADQIGLLPSELQAITWVTIRRQVKYGFRQLPLF